MRKVGVHPEAEFAARRRLFAALEDVFPLTFEPRDANTWAGLDAAILLRDDVEPLEAVRRQGLRCYRVAAGDGASASPSLVSFAVADVLDRRLRGQELPHEPVRTLAAVPTSDADTVLATGESGPLWTQRGPSPTAVDTVALAPDELGDPWTLRYHLQGTRFLGLLPLVHFSRSLCPELGPVQPPLRANFHLDDPNLHWTRYGYVDYRTLAGHAETHGYHISIATIPLDTWFAHPATVRCFQKHPDHLSLLIHGNDHGFEELGRLESTAAARTVLSEALRRVRRFERRYALEVSPVMVAPRDRCSKSSIRAMAQLSYEGLVTGYARPWASSQWTTCGHPFSHWLPANLFEGGFPMLRRFAFSNWGSADWSRGEIVFNAFLDQPICLFGHHQDLRGDGLDRLAEIAEFVNSLGEVSWGSPGDALRRNWLTRREGGLLRVQPYSRWAEVPLPEDVTGIVFDPAPTHTPVEGEVIAHRTAAGEGVAEFGEIVPIEGDVPTRLEFSIPGEQGAVESLGRPRGRFWAVTRRLLTEARDRCRPALDRIATSTSK